MPPGGAAARAEQLATLERLVARAAGRPRARRGCSTRWSRGPRARTPTPTTARLVALGPPRPREGRRGSPTDLAVEMARASAARASTPGSTRARRGDFGRFRDALARQIELRRQYAACFPDAAHPYDVLLDDFEPGMTHRRGPAAVRRAARRPRPARRRGRHATAARATAACFDGRLPDGRPARARCSTSSASSASTPTHWRLDAAPHPFARRPATATSASRPATDETTSACPLLRPARVRPRALRLEDPTPSLRRTPLHDCASLGIHESQSRLWENIVGRGAPVLPWLLPRLQETLARRLRRPRRRRPCSAASTPSRGR